MARSPLFWVYCLWATCAICAGLMIIGDAKSSALAVGLEAGFATLLGFAAFMRLLHRRARTDGRS